MAQIPILIPLILAGFFLGSVPSSKDLASVWRKAMVAGALSGILNTGYAWFLGSLKIVSATGNNLGYLASCGVLAFIVVIVIYVSALGMARYRRGKSIEPEE